MAKTVSLKGGVIVDLLKDLKQQLGMPIKKGKVTKVRDNYYFAADGNKILLPVGTLISAREIKPLVGKEVFGIFSAKNKSSLIAIDAVPLPDKPFLRRPFILCYLPVPDFMVTIKDKYKKQFIKDMLQDNIITPEFFKGMEVIGI